MIQGVECGHWVFKSHKWFWCAAQARTRGLTLVPLGSLSDECRPFMSLLETAHIISVTDTFYNSTRPAIAAELDGSRSPKSVAFGWEMHTKKCKMYLFFPLSFTPKWARICSCWTPLNHSLHHLTSIFGAPVMGKELWESQRLLWCKSTVI